MIGGIAGDGIGALLLAGGFGFAVEGDAGAVGVDQGDVAVRLAGVGRQRSVAIHQRIGLRRHSRGFGVDVHHHVRGAAIIVGGGAVRVPALARQVEEPRSQRPVGISAALIQRPGVVCADPFGHRGDPLPIQRGIGTGEAQQDLGDPVFGFQDLHTAVADPHPDLAHRGRVVPIHPDVDGVIEFLDR
nr:hypothetical protein [Mycolicibacterium tokaiense]